MDNENRLDMGWFLPGLHMGLSGLAVVLMAVFSSPDDAVEPYTLGNCAPVTGDALRAQVTWKDRKTIEHDAKESLRVVFELKKAKLYSFWID